MIYDVGTLIKAVEQRDAGVRAVAEERLRKARLEMNEMERRNRADQRRIAKRAVELADRARVGPEVSRAELDDWFRVEGRPLGTPAMTMARLQNRLAAAEDAVQNRKYPSELAEFLKVLLEQGKTQITTAALDAAGYPTNYRNDFAAFLAALRSTGVRA